MKYSLHHLALAAVLVFGTSSAVFADQVNTDYDHNANFSTYHTYSWQKFTSKNPFVVDRVKAAVDKELQAKGWQLTPSGGSVTVFATDSVHNEKELETMYDGMGGGWGGGWGWGGWGGMGGMGMGMGGMGDATTSTVNQKMGKLVIDLFEANSKKLLWRGSAAADLSNNSSKNTKNLDKDIAKMFKQFPPKADK